MRSRIQSIGFFPTAGANAANRTSYSRLGSGTSEVVLPAGTVKVPAKTKLRFKLDQPLHLRETF
jgi:hypothetical protein